MDSMSEMLKDSNLTQSPPWLRIDPAIWQEAFLYLDAKSLFNASTACKHFSDIVSSVAVLKKIKFSLQFPEFDDDVQIKIINDRLRNQGQLTRRYQNLEINRLRESFLNFKTETRPGSAKGKKEAKLRASLKATCEMLSTSVQVMTIRNCDILRKDVTDILRPFVHVRDLTLNNIVLSDDWPTTGTGESMKISFPNLRALRLSQCDFFCLLIFKLHDRLETFELKEPSYIRTDIEEAEKFLLQQTCLKDLKLKSFRFNSTYSSNRLGSVPFQLESLSLNNVKWDIANHCELFVKSQTNLRKLELKSVHQWLPPHEPDHRMFTDIVRHFLTRNQRLTTFSFDSAFYQDLKGIDLIPDIVNPNITQLTFSNRDNNSNVFNNFTRIFPNVKTLSYKGQLSPESGSSLQRFAQLESLDLTLEPKSLANLNLGTDKLKKFEYCASNEEKSLIPVAEFLAKNPKISDLSLNIEPITFEEISELVMCLSPCLESFTLSDLYLNQTEAELLIHNFPQLRQLRSDIQLKPEIISILAASNIKFEKINNSSLYKRQ